MSEPQLGFETFWLRCFWPCGVRGPSKSSRFVLVQVTFASAIPCGLTRAPVHGCVSNRVLWFQRSSPRAWLLLLSFLLETRCEISGHETEQVFLDCCAVHLNSLRYLRMYRLMSHENKMQWMPDRAFRKCHFLKQTKFPTYLSIFPEAWKWIIYDIPMSSTHLRASWAARKINIVNYWKTWKLSFFNVFFIFVYFYWSFMMNHSTSLSASD